MGDGAGLGGGHDIADGGGGARPKGSRLSSDLPRVNGQKRKTMMQHICSRSLSRFIFAAFLIDIFLLLMYIV
ncbi:hypothetical protein PanWU01x14_141150 [Parasponia andersonii]|uniref:Transmembrane protein n=1 Tax=Parasponia andersonii TaxID=3476 RepID=A0A2P5CM59_PARAD|nr:hypothetical protein PanWU01x14_141150 [Parasponia andersonii]